MQGEWDQTTAHVASLIKAYLEKEKASIDAFSRHLSLPPERARAFLRGEESLCIQELSAVVDFFITK